MAKALAYEIRRLGMGAMDSDFIMKTDYAYPTSRTMGKAGSDAGAEAPKRT